MMILHRNQWRRLWQFWAALRQLSHDDAYERYLAHHAAEHAGTAPLTAREFYVQEQRRKWSGVTRCC